VRRFQRDGIVAASLGTGLVLECDGEALLLDVPEGSAARLAALGVLPRIRAIAFSGGRVQSVGGLVPVLCAMAPGRGDTPLPVWSVLGEERGGLLADAWFRGWGGFPLAMDGEAPGTAFEAGPFRVVTSAIRRGEPGRWGILSVPAVGFRVAAGGVEVAFVPGAGPGSAVERLVRGADLAVVEVGVTPWPPSPEPWRLTADAAIHAAQGARELWLVGDDGEEVAVGGYQ
jgi:hypothetical protein